jgi:flavin reductase (DIM6/NTAB) family NADH-FMN oxidoreductase RutF
MFYETNGPHGLAHNPFKALVAPRPIGWISTLGPDGTPNLAPYSYFNAIGNAPPMVMFAPNGRVEGRLKDTLTNVEGSGEFVVNIVTERLKEAMNETARHVPAATDEFALAGLTPEPACLIGAPRVAETPVHLECRHHQTLELPADDAAVPQFIVLGQVLGIHIDEAVLKDGMVDMAKLRPIARLGYFDYCVVDNVFSMPTPD